jgi:hypothetical protein
MRSTALAASLAVGLCALAPAARGQQPGAWEPHRVQLTPFAAYQSGGSVYSPVYAEGYDFDGSLSWGGTLDVTIDGHWGIEALYSKQDTELVSGSGFGPAIGVSLERMLVGIQEEKGEERLRYFGTLLLGATRFSPRFDGYDSTTKFTGALGLGIKTFFTRNVGLRLEGRLFYTVVEADGGAICAGACLVTFSSSGLWQTDIGGGLIIAF